MSGAIGQRQRSASDKHATAVVTHCERKTVARNRKHDRQGDHKDREWVARASAKKEGHPDDRRQEG
jgi:hypothetical protein